MYFFKALGISILAFFCASAGWSQALRPEAGAQHSAAIEIWGTVAAWGENCSGQVGDGTVVDKSIPRRVLKGEYHGTTYIGDDSLNPIISVSLSPGFTEMLDASGQVYTLGVNFYGGLGIGSGFNQISYTPVPVKVYDGEYAGTIYLGDNPDDPIVEVNCGALGGSCYSDRQTVALALDKSGLVYAWGSNDYGQLGNLSAGERQSLPIRVLCGQYSGSKFLGDDAANPITRILVGSTIAGALDKDGLVYCWGTDSSGECGTGSLHATVSVPLKVVRGSYPGTIYFGDNPQFPITSISQGGKHTLALADVVYSWGQNNNDGLLGDGTRIDRKSPVKVLKGDYPGTMYLGDNPANHILKISAGSSLNLALDKMGRVYSWGGNDSCQLGLGNDIGFGLIRTLVPRIVPVGGELPATYGTTYLGDNPDNPVVDISAGHAHALVLMKNGELVSWGDDTSGELGDSAALPSTYRCVPTLVAHGKCFDEANKPYPVTNLISFTAQLQSKVALLNWTTSAELRCSMFFIDRSFDSLSWTPFGEDSGAGTSGAPHSYTHQDYVEQFRSNQAVPIFYRLRFLDVDGNVASLGTAVKIVLLPFSDVDEPALDPTPIVNGFRCAPNPFSNAISISYDLGTKQNLELDLIDSQGKRVRTLASGMQESGRHDFTIDAEGLPDGIYYCRLESGKNSLVRQIILVR